jgi:hypothetical protein
VPEKRRMNEGVASERNGMSSEMRRSRMKANEMK